MGLDIYFYDKNRTEIGYFRKVNFLLTYFDIDDEKNCKFVRITKKKFSEFVKDIEEEYVEYFKKKMLLSSSKEEICIEPKNLLFKTKYVFFGGNMEYNELYWNNLFSVREWAKKMLEKIDWKKDRLYIWCWW